MICAVRGQSALCRPFDITPDCRFIIISGRPKTDAGGGWAPSITLVLNWFEELKRLVPVR